MLVNSTTVSALRSQNSVQDFRRHVALLRDMKKDLDVVFKKIRGLKARIKDRYPDAYAVGASRSACLRSGVVRPL
jgi:hypothetical protein